MANWNRLSPGDLVDVVAPASSCSEEELRSGLRYLERQGLRYRIRKPLFRRQGYLSNTDEKRLEDLKTALLAPDSQAVWCVRGGYGSQRLLPELSRLRSPRRPKLFVGLSDITALHLFLNGHWNWPTLFAPILTRMGRDNVPAKERKEVERVILGTTDEVVFKNLKAFNTAAKKLRGQLQGSIWGGNLTLVQASVGTPWQPDLTKKFLFLEDVGERGYRLDRALVQMNQAGLFNGCRAVLLGDFVGGDEPDGKNTIPWTLRRFFVDMRLPVFSGIPAGHGDYQRPVPFNTKCLLSSSGKSYRLECSTGCKIAK